MSPSCWPRSGQRKGMAMANATSFPTWVLDGAWLEPDQKRQFPFLSLSSEDRSESCRHQRRLSYLSSCELLLSGLLAMPQLSPYQSLAQRGTLCACLPAQASPDAGHVIPISLPSSWWTSRLARRKILTRLRGKIQRQLLLGAWAGQKGGGLEPQSYHRGVGEPLLALRRRRVGKRMATESIQKRIFRERRQTPETRVALIKEVEKHLQGRTL